MLINPIRADEKWVTKAMLATILTRRLSTSRENQVKLSALSRKINDRTEGLADVVREKARWALKRSESAHENRKIMRKVYKDVYALVIPEMNVFLPRIRTVLLAQLIFFLSISIAHRRPTDSDAHRRGWGERAILTRVMIEQNWCKLICFAQIKSMRWMNELLTSWVGNYHSSFHLRRVARWQWTVGIKVCFEESLSMNRSPHSFIKDKSCGWRWSRRRVEHNLFWASRTPNRKVFNKLTR